MGQTRRCLLFSEGQNFIDTWLSIRIRKGSSLSNSQMSRAWTPITCPAVFEDEHPRPMGAEHTKHPGCALWEAGADHAFTPKWGPGLAKDVCPAEGAKRNVTKSNPFAPPANAIV